MSVASVNSGDCCSLPFLRSVFDECLQKLDAVYGECDRAQLVNRRATDRDTHHRVDRAGYHGSGSAREASARRAIARSFRTECRTRTPPGHGGECALSPCGTTACALHRDLLVIFSTVRFAIVWLRVEFPQPCGLDGLEIEKPDIASEPGSLEGRVSAIVHVIDDDTLFRAAIGRVLKAAGYQVLAYKSAPQFLTRLRDDEQPSCILFDVKMPGLERPRITGALGQGCPIDPHCVPVRAGRHPRERQGH